MMNCYIHPDREAEWTCNACGQPVCPECKVVLQNRIYCNPCADKMYLAALTRKEVSWFEKHLNLTFVIGLAHSAILTIIGGIVIAMLNPDISEETLAVQMQLLGWVLSLFIMFPIARWVIRKKARNPWNVLWLLMPFGIVMLLLLTNMSKGQQNNFKSPRIP